ncbi:CHC2 zinc finger domain-containing protein [Streptomyces asiaticus]|uniref:CHC2 zinc finger domain-containing protein n=1 Tax=Streptomyces asiaticus TaxID=114695 RepID=UPI003F67FFB3
MRWRRVDERAESDEPKPTLEATMEHFGVKFSPSRNIGMAACPLHDDRTPSFSYRLDEGLWNCHSCSNGGDSFTLIAKYSEMQEGKVLTFPEVKQYARDNGLEEGAAPAREETYASRYGGGRRAPGKKPTGKAGGGYIPAWKRH